MSDTQPTLPKLDGDKVPQANNPELLLKLLALVAAEQPLEQLGVTDRQIYYYTSAARLLRLLSENGRLLSAGRILLQLPEAHRLARLAIAFEQSECGAAWARWERVRSVLEVDPSSAERFLKEATTGIDGDTLKRRVGTLHAWCKKLLPAHPARRLEPQPCRGKRYHAAIGHTAVFETAESAKVVQKLALDAELVRVATAYLSVNGYEILTEPLRESTVRLLVGSEDTFVSLAEILDLFQTSIVSGPPSLAKKQAIARLYDGAVTGSVRVRYLDPKHKPRLHAKVYIFDEYAAYITSANLSRGGLRSNIEAGYTVRAEEPIRYYIEHFDHFFERAEDFLPLLLAILEQSWALQPAVSPYLLYLRVLLELFPSPPDLSQQTDFRLSPYQEMLVAAVLRTLRERRRALLVSPTGTGKTIIGSYVAASLFKETITRTVVLSPNPRIEKNWISKMARFGLRPDTITHGIMQRKGRRSEIDEQRFAERLSSFRDTDLVIVDECHAFRNHETNGYESLAKLAESRSDRKGPQLLFLTATPISKSIDDLNTLVGLLSDRPLRSVVEVAQTQSVINVTLPFIIQHFGTDGKGGRGNAIRFGDELKYFASVRARKEPYPSSTEDAFQHIIAMEPRLRRASEALQLRLTGFTEEDITGRRSPSSFLKLTLMRRTESSPRAILNTIANLEQAIDARKILPEDPVALKASLRRLRRLIPGVDQDSKLNTLITLLKSYQPRRKVLIFSLWTATVAYIAEALGSRLKDRVIDYVTGELTHTARGDKIVSFAPKAQGRPGRRRKGDIDILVATDAIAEGEDMQDADVVINYDLPWTPLYLIQRIGRVQRATKEPRVVEVSNFYPDSDQFEAMVKLWERLNSRSEQIAELSRMQVLKEQDRDLEQLGERDLRLVQAFIESGDYEHMAQEYLPTSAWLVDRAKASPDEIEEARALPEGALAAKGGPRAGIFVLLRCGEELHSIFSPADGGELEVSPEPVPHETMVQHIRAERDTPQGALPEGLATDVGRVVKRWSTERGVDDVDVTVICAETMTIS